MKSMTQAELSQATTRARNWFERNRKRFRYYLPERIDRTYEQVYDEALNEIETTLHLCALSEAFEANARPEMRDRAAQPSLAPEHSPASITVPSQPIEAQAWEREYRKPTQTTSEQPR